MTLYGSPGIKFIMAALVITGISLAFVLAATWGPAAQAQSIGVPGAPVDLDVTPGDTSAVLTWRAPSSDGGSEITDYQYRYYTTAQPGIILMPGSLTVREGVAAGSSYTVSLVTQPPNDVTVAITGTLGTDLTLDKTSLTFTRLDWFIPQTVTVVAAHDSDQTDDRTTLTHTASGGGFDQQTADLPVTVSDDDTVSLLLSKYHLAVGEGDSTGGSYTVELSSQPAENVTVAITGQSGTDLTLSSTSLTFTTGNWSDAQTVTVTAASDTDQTDDSASLIHTASGGGYGNKTAKLTVVVREQNWTTVNTRNGLTAIITGLTNGTEYTFEVRAVNSAGSGKASIVQAVPFVELTTSISTCMKCVYLGYNHYVVEGGMGYFRLRRFSTDSDLTVTVDVVEFNDHGSVVAKKELGKRRVTFKRGMEDAVLVVPTIDDDTYDAHGDHHPTLVGTVLPGHNYAVPPEHIGLGHKPASKLIVEVRDNDFPPGVVITSEVDDALLQEGESTTLTFTFTSHLEPHSGTGNYAFSVAGVDSGDYMLTPSELSVPLSAFERPGYDEQDRSTFSAPYVGRGTVILTAVDDPDGELAEEFTISLQKGDGAPEDITLPDGLELTIAKSDLPEFSIRSPYPDDSPPGEHDGRVKFEVMRDVPVATVQPLSIEILATHKMIVGERETTRTINIGPGITSRFIYVHVKGDHRYEHHATITATILDDDEDDGFMVSPTENRAQVTVLDDDFPWGVQMGIEADRSTISEGQDAELTFTFKTRDGGGQPHADTGTFNIGVQGGSTADYSLSAGTISVPHTAFQLSHEGRYEATSTVTFTALADGVTETSENFTISVTRGDDAQESIGLPESLTLTISGTTGPGLPESVAAKPSASSGINVTWAAPQSNGGSDITGYLVQWKRAADSWNMAEDVSEARTDGTSYTIEGLDPGVRYSVRVVATNSTDDGLPSGDVEATTNNPATGAPTISGWVQVGWALTADTAAFSDLDGLTGARYSYQWIRVSGGTGADISDATNASYTLVDADEGKTIKVRVSFTDDLGNGESLTSAATVTVEPEPAALEASFLTTPASHDGENTFNFELRFSEAPRSDFSYRVLRDHAFTVSGGRITRTPRMEKPGNIRWNIIVRPDGDGAVTVVLPQTANCADLGAICTDDGRMLSNRLEVTVLGP